MSQRGQDVRQERRLVAAAPGLRPQVARRQERCVGFDHQTLRGDAGHEIAQAQATAVVANPAGDADVQAELEIGSQLPIGAGEAVDDRRPQPWPPRTQDGEEAVVGGPFVEEDRQSGFGPPAPA